MFCGQTIPTETVAVPLQAVLLEKVQQSEITISAVTFIATLEKLNKSVYSRDRKHYFSFKSVLEETTVQTWSQQFKGVWKHTEDTEKAIMFRKDNSQSEPAIYTSLASSLKQRNMEDGLGNIFLVYNNFQKENVKIEV